MRAPAIARALLIAAALAAASGAEAQPPRLTLDAALVSAMEHNRELRVQRYAPRLRETDVEVARAAFDPTVSASASVGHAEERLDPPLGDGSARTASWSAEVGAEQLLPTGTTLAVDASAGRDASAVTGVTATSRASLTVTQALLRGAGPAANLASVREARLEVEASAFELRGFISTLAAEVETAYWRESFAAQRVAILAGSVALAQRQLDEAKEAVAIGKLAGVELAAAEAELALRREEEIAARGQHDEARLRLADLAGLPADQAFAVDAPPDTAEALEAIEPRLELARRLRPEVNQARLRLRQGALEVARTRNGLLPKLDAFVALGGTGYATSFPGSVRGDDGARDEIAVGLRFTQALGDREARAHHESAVLSREQAEAALANLERLVELDVRLAHAAAASAAELIGARAASEAAQRAKLDAETEKLRSGSSTSLAVAQAQRDLLTSRLATAEAATAYRIALAELQRSDGSLLARRGIDAPGARPAE